MKPSIKNKILFVLSVIFGLMFINAGLNKFLNYMPIPDDLSDELLSLMTAFTEFGWLIPLVGVAEILGGILIIPPKTRALGALIIFPVMIGILLTNIITDTSGLLLTLFFAAIFVWIIIDNREKYLHLVK